MPAAVRGRRALPSLPSRRTRRSCPSKLLTDAIAHALANTAASALTILAFVSAALPAAVLQLLLRPTVGPSSHSAYTKDTLSAAWGPCTLQQIHGTLESRCRQYPASQAFVTLVHTLVERLPLSHDIAGLVRDLAAGMGLRPYAVAAASARLTRGC